MLRDAGGPGISDEAVGSQDMAPIAAAAAAALAKVGPAATHESALSGMLVQQILVITPSVPDQIIRINRWSYTC